MAAPGSDYGTDGSVVIDIDQPGLLHFCAAARSCSRVPKRCAVS